jgi:inhibitor of cysteine peptidase
MSELRITTSDKDKIFNARLEDKIVISLEENPTTGYEWEIDKIDDELFEHIGSEFSVIPEKDSEKKIGAGGLRVMKFRTKKTGDGHIQLKQWRRWERDSSITDWFRIIIRIGK